MKTERTKTPDPQLRQQLDAKIQKYNEAFDKNDAGAVAVSAGSSRVPSRDCGASCGTNASAVPTAISITAPAVMAPLRTLRRSCSEGQK